MGDGVGPMSYVWVEARQTQYSMFGLGGSVTKGFDGTANASYH